MKKLSDVSFLVWLACFVLTMVALTNNITFPDSVPVILFFLGLASFGLFWLISLLWLVLDKVPFIIAFNLPFYSVIITALIGFTAWSFVPEFNQTPAPISQKPSITTTPTPTTTPSPKAVKKTVQMPKTECVGPDGVHFQTTQKECDSFNAAWGKSSTTTANQGLCHDPDGNVIAKEKCPWLSNNSQTQTNQPSNNNDYYVPTYTYTSNYVPLSVPSIPTYKTYQPSYPTANVPATMPTIGQSKPIQNNCETFTTNAGSVTICK